jgi:16S rRNA (guanine527-N7)-methyltransferase
LAYANVLERWNTRINLIGRSTVNVLWERHFSDSAQLVGHAPPGIRSWLDLGSGAGLPGLVIAAILAETQPGARVTMIESDARKCAFLAEAARVMALSVAIKASRIEAVEAFEADVISARALAPLDRLLDLSEPFCGKRTVLLFPKGRAVETELTEAERRWHIEAKLHPSLTDPEAQIVEVLRFQRRRAER